MFPSASNGGKRATRKLRRATGLKRIVSQGEDMNWDQLEGKWKVFTGSARERWGKLADNDWETIAGKKDQLVGRLQQRYGVAKEEAEKQADEWLLTLTPAERKSQVASRS
jgi:uncharacterized protein YjbJ (UPF0337 family)